MNYARAAAKSGRLDAHHVATIAEELSKEGLRRSRNARVVDWIPSDAARAPNKGRATRAKSGRTASHLARPYAHPYYWAGFIYTGL